MARLLVVEDDPKILRSLGQGLRAEGHEVVTADHGGEDLAKGLKSALDAQGGKETLTEGKTRIMTVPFPEDRPWPTSSRTLRCRS